MLPGATNGEQPHPQPQSIRNRSRSRDSSINEYPRSLVDSISAASLRQNWSGKETVEDDPSLSSISSTIDHALEIDDLPPESSLYQTEPIILRGNGNLTLFGLSNSFSSEFPSALIGRISKEEFDHTMRRINLLLRDQQSLSAKLLFFGGLCCCCSLGFSLVWPSIALKKRSKMSVEKFLASENSRLYSKLGLNLRLAEQRCYSNHAFVEYVLMVEFTPKINLYLPD